MGLLLFQQPIEYTRRSEIKVKVYFFLSLNWQGHYLKKNLKDQKGEQKTNAIVYTNLIFSGFLI